MTSPRRTQRRGRAAAIFAALVVGAWAAACASVESVNFSNGDCVAGGCPQTGASSSTSSTGGPCNVDAGCAVSWQTDIFTGIIDGPAGCTSMLCHQSGMGGITLTSGDAHGAYTTLKGYTLAATPGPVKPYIVGCDPQGSAFTCNMAVDQASGTNPFGACGSAMPKFKNYLTVDQVNTIAQWIQCGAPEN
jgi:hypothetical protein